MTNEVAQAARQASSSQRGGFRKSTNERSVSYVLPINGRRRALIGILLLFIEMCFFTITNILIRVTSHELSITEIVLFRNLGALTLIFPLSLPSIIGWSSGRRAIPTRHHVKACLLICLTSYIAIYTWCFSVTHLALGTATALFYSRSLFIATLANLFCLEVIPARYWAMISLGFLGAFIVLRPSLAAIGIVSGLGLISAAASALSALQLKTISHTAPPVAITFLITLIMTPLAALPIVGSNLSVTPRILVLAVAFGVLWIGSQFATVFAYRNMRSAVIASMDFCRLLFAILIGNAVFGDIIDAHTCIGGALILSTATLTSIFALTNRNTVIAS